MDRPNPHVFAPIGTLLRRMAQDTELLARAREANPWFTPTFVRQALLAMAPWFDAERLSAFIDRYPPQAPQRVGLIFAGNLPLVGLHDLLVLLLAGHLPLVKPSHKDQVLFKALHEGLAEDLQMRISVVEQLRPEKLDFLVATGSDNTARYVAHDFQTVPRLVRGNRFSAALLCGDESANDLAALARDVLDFHGMGCRSVSNVLVPAGYNPKALILALEGYPEDFLAMAWNKVVLWENALCTMENRLFAPCARIVLEKAEGLKPARIGVLRVIEYREIEEARLLLTDARDRLQCSVGKGLEVGFGEAQCPGMTDFADGVDVLLKLSHK